MIELHKYLPSILLAFSVVFLAKAELLNYTASVLGDSGACAFAAVVRLYDPYSVASMPMPKLDVLNSDGSTISDIPWNMTMYYNYSIPYIGWSGQMLLGSDQYAVYLMTNISALEDRYALGVNVMGVLPRAAYLNVKYEWMKSATGECLPPHRFPFHLAVSTADKSDFEMIWEGGQNPYIPGNPSTIQYYLQENVENPSSSSNNSTTDTRFSPKYVDEPSNSNRTSVSSVSSYDGFVPVYRLDKATTKISQPDGHSESGCSASYLFAPLFSGIPFELGFNGCRETLFQYGLMKVLIPYAFDVFDTADVTFQSYDARYFSVGAHQCNATRMMPFWTVNTRLMAALLQESAAGAAGRAAYIFFAPPEDVREAAIAQFGVVGPTPPTHSWGGFTGHLLATPDYAFIFRYRAPAPGWAGNPELAPCYATPIENQAVTGLGDWAPSIYGDNFASFADFSTAPSIGSVIAGSSWPASP